MIVVKSSCTGQTLFALSVGVGDVSVTPQEARHIIESLGKSPIAHLVQVSRSGHAPTAVGCMLGIAASEDEGVELDYNHPFHNKVK